MPEQGDIYDFDFGPQTDSHQEGKRPALVIQTNSLNELDAYPLTIVVPLSTKGRPSLSHVRFEPSYENGLVAVTFAKCEQIYTVPKARLDSRRGKVSAQGLFDVKQALRAVLAH